MYGCWVAGDKRVDGLVGYSENGTYNPNDVAPAMKFYLERVQEAMAPNKYKKKKNCGGIRFITD